ncbi:MAG: cytochrome c maturation protein CcmE [Legionellales bacterium]|nr:cytochrome c maturation protein CcmE [Legionellales bacterium]
MNTVRRHRLIWMVVIGLGLAIATGLTLYALGNNLNAFYSPHDIAQAKVEEGQTFRVGGLVVERSVRRLDDGLTVQFTLTDNQAQVDVLYTGILPDLFREGQGIVALGALNEQQQFIATQVLAKHDATYMPPEVQHALAQS